MIHNVCLINYLSPFDIFLYKAHGQCVNQLNLFFEKTINHKFKSSNWLILREVIFVYHKLFKK
jgi:hypothetical protein